MTIDTTTVMRLLDDQIDTDRLVDTARQLIEVPSPTCHAGKVSDALADLLMKEGFAVERHDAGHPDAPAVVVRWHTGRPGPLIELNGHLDTVHLPFVPFRRVGDLLHGSGSCDMKGGVAAAVETLRVLRDSGALTSGGVLLVAHDLHEAPWGFSAQLDNLIKEGVHGDVVLIPEPLRAHLPIRGRGAATWKATLRRLGNPVHEVMRPINEPAVIEAAARLALVLFDLNHALAEPVDPLAGSASAFIGQIHSGEIYNQYPQEAMLEGTRRWLPGSSALDVEESFRALVQQSAGRTGVEVDLEYRVIRGAFELDPSHPFVSAFQSAHSLISGAPLPTGPKPFVDDGNSFSALAGVPAITHGALSGGQHTTSEWVSVADLARLVKQLALTAVLHAGGAIH